MNTNQNFNKQTTENTVNTVVVPKRGRGRPKGSKNKPKVNKTTNIPPVVNYTDLK